MSTERTFEQLASELEDVYGPISGKVYYYYTVINPLEKSDETISQYWENVRCFLDELHKVLYNKEHTHAVENITTEGYYFLCKMCIDRSFTVSDLINIRNNRTSKYGKILANEISHNVLPLHIMYLRQITNRSHYGLNQPQVGKPNYAHQLPQVMPGMMSNQMMPMPMPMTGMMPNPMMSMPGMIHPMMMPNPMMMTPPADRPEQVKTERVRPKPRCVRRNAQDLSPEGEDGPIIPLPIDGCDTIPLNFYGTYCGDAAGKYAAVPKEHHIPKIMPVSNQPPPPQ